MIEVVAEAVVDIEVVMAGKVDREADQVAKESNGEELIGHNSNLSRASYVLTYLSAFTRQI